MRGGCFWCIVFFWEVFTYLHTANVSHNRDLPMELSVFAVFTIGFLGSAHCVGMCGGIVGALNAGLLHGESQSRISQVAYHLNYNIGRILSYSIAGALAGFAGAQSSKLPLEVVLPVGELIGGIVMILLGLYLAGWSQIVTRIERLGLYIWKYIQPLGKHFMPVHTPLHAFGVGVVWGWLPCGLVYSALALSLLSASPATGALLMLAFGLGTLPMLLIMGGAYEQLRGIVRKPATRQLAGAAVILVGVYTSLSAMSGDGHEHAAGSGVQTEDHAH